MKRPDDPWLQPDRDPDFLDSAFAEWNSSILCSDEQVSKMWKRVSDTLAEKPVRETASIGETVSSNADGSKTLFSDTPRFGWGLAALAAGVLILVGLGIYGSTRSSRTSNLETASKVDSLVQFAFSKSEIQESQVLACEVSLLCSKPVLVRKKLTSWDIDDDPIYADANSKRPHSPKMLLRCVLLEAVQSPKSGSVTWHEIKREEVISGDDHQIELLSESKLPLQTWAHLLPDNRLWTEFQDGEGGQVLRQNQPSIVWESLGNDSPRRLVVVYEILDSCDQEYVL